MSEDSEKKESEIRNFPDVIREAFRGLNEHDQERLDIDTFTGYADDLIQAGYITEAELLKKASESSSLNFLIDLASGKKLMQIMHIALKQKKLKPAFGRDKIIEYKSLIIKGDISKATLDLVDMLDKLQLDAIDRKIIDSYNS